LTINEEDDLKLKISQACVYIHTSLIKASSRYLSEHKRYYYVTPSCYIDLLRTFSKIYESKTSEYLRNLARLKSGLEKLSDANRLVALMKEELIVLGPQIELKAKETEQLLEKLKKDQEAVNEVRYIVAKEEEKMRIETEQVSKYAQEAEKDLADVIPLLAAARESLNALNKADVSEIR
jgi:dynein heavy chain